MADAPIDYLIRLAAREVGAPVAIEPSNDRMLPRIVHVTTEGGEQATVQVHTSARLVEVLELLLAARGEAA